MKPLLAALAALGLYTSAGAADIFRGGEIYRTHCAACHGNDGRPVQPSAPDFKRFDSLLKPDIELMKVVRGGRGTMPSFEGLLRDRDILDVVAHLRTLSQR